MRNGEGEVVEDEEEEDEEEEEEKEGQKVSSVKEVVVQ